MFHQISPTNARERSKQHDKFTALFKVTVEDLLIHCWQRRFSTAIMVLIYAALQLCADSAVLKFPVRVNVLYSFVNPPPTRLSLPLS